MAPFSFGDCMKHFALGLTLAACLASAASAKPFKDMFPQIYDSIGAAEKPGIDAMDLQQGKVTLDGKIATFDLPEGYYFLGSRDARFVLETLWGNPADADTLGLVFPPGVSPYQSDSWALEVYFDKIGYVSDSDAAAYDYKDMLTQMQSDAEAGNADRKAKGFEAIHVLGWAAEPRYDQATRKLYWAKRLQFEGSDGETLNYNIRALGRHGVLVMNFIASMQDLPKVEAALPDVLKMVNFTDGNRYSDYLPGVDTVAAVGIGGLIAGQVLAKTGILLVILAFAKKFIFLIFLPVIALFGRVKGWLQSRRGGGDSDAGL